VVHGEHAQRRPEGTIGEGQLLGNRAYHGRRADRSLADHHSGRLDGDHLPVWGLVGTAASADIHHRRRDGWPAWMQTQVTAGECS
jgi:hypothetical protein